VHRNKIPHYEKYYHYVENCLLTPIYLPRMLPIEWKTYQQVIEITELNELIELIELTIGDKLWPQFQIKF